MCGPAQYLGSQCITGMLSAYCSFSRPLYKLMVDHCVKLHYLVSLLPIWKSDGIQLPSQIYTEAQMGSGRLFFTGQTSRCSTES